MVEQFLKRYNIKVKPEKILTYIFYILAILVAFYSIAKMLSFWVGNIRIDNNISPYLYAVLLTFAPLAFSFYVNSGLPKNDMQKVQMYVVTCGLMAIIVGTMVCTWINEIAWYVLEKIPGYQSVLKDYPELFAPDVTTVCSVVPFISLFKIIDYFLLVFREEDYFKGVAGFVGISLKSNKKDNGAFSCDNVICLAKGTSVPVVVPEKKRYEATLVQGATGTGKTATVLLPMSARDLEKKYFFREYAKKIGYSLLKRGIAYMNGPFNNEYINRNFTLDFIRPKRGMEEQFMEEVKPLVQYIDNSTGKISYRNVGITVVENDGKFISDFIGVAKNFDIDVLSIDPASPETTLSINPFAIPDPAKVASIVADVLNTMYESTGGGKGAGDPFFTQVTIDAFQNLSILLKEMYPILHNGEIASLEDMLELLYNFDAVEEMTEEMKKIPELEQKYKLLIKYFEKNFYKPALNINGFEIPGTRGSGRKDTEKFLYGAITQLNNLVRHPGLKAALCGKNNIIDFDKALEDGSIITACSRKGELGILQAKAFGMFFILQFQDAVLRRKGVEDSRTPHFLYIDEFPEYITKDMEVMFTLFRKYRCGVTIAIQNLSQLEKSGHGYYRQTVLANTKTQIIFGDTVPEDSAYWEKAFGKEKVPDVTSKYNLSTGELVKTTVLETRKKERAEWFKIADQGFGAVYYKTKNASGKTIYGQGKTSFLDSKYNEKSRTLMFNFEKYMMTKPESPTITMNDSDSDPDSNPDVLFGTNTISKLNSELNKMSATSSAPIKDDDLNDSIFANNQSTIGKVPKTDDDIEILFEDLEPTLEDSATDGGAITETYESPSIKHNK